MPQLSKKLAATTRSALLQLRPGRSTVPRRFIAIGYRANDHLDEEAMLEVAMVAIRDGEIQDYRRWIGYGRSRSSAFALDSVLPPAAATQSVVTDGANVPGDLDDIEAWLSKGGGGRITLVGNGVQAISAHLIRADVGLGALLGECDLLDTTALSGASEGGTSSPSSKDLADSLGLTDVAVDSALGDALDAAAVFRTLSRRQGPPLEGLIVSRTTSHPATGGSAADGRDSRRPRQRATIGAHARGTSKGPTPGRIRHRSAPAPSGPGSGDNLELERLSPRFLRVFFSVYFVIGLGLIALFPPFQSPDAFEHFDRAVGISQGQFVTSTIKGVSGSRLPVDVLDSEIPFSQIPFDPIQRVTRTEFRYGFAQLWNTPQTFTKYPTGAYLPFLYLPQTIGVWLGKLVSQRILVGYYLAELMNFVAFVALAKWSMSQLPKRIAASLGVLLIFPSVGALAVSVNPDALFIALSMVFAASCFNSFVDSGRGSEPRGEVGSRLRPRPHLSTRYGFAYISLFFMVIEKPPYLVLALLLPIAELYSNLRSYILKILGFGATSALVYALWAKFGAQGKGGPAIPGVISPVRQFLFVLHYPWNFMHVLFRTFRFGALPYGMQFLAGIGWLDGFFPRWFYLLLTAIFLTAVFLAYRRREKVGRMLWLLAALFATFFAIILSFYLVYSPYTWPAIDGFQGRYLIPLIPPLLVILGLETSRAPRLPAVRDTIMSYADVALISLQLLVAAEFAVTLLNRYWR